VDGVLRTRTHIEPRLPGGGGAGEQGPVRPPRPWYLIPIVLAVLAAGVGAGWLAREQAGGDLVETGFDPDDVLKTTGPAVVRVYASSCSGSGRATGVMLGDGRVLTVAAALSGPISVAIQTPDGRIREARVIGADTTGSGIAVLQVRGDPLDVKPAELAASVPADTTKDVPVIGYADDAKQVVDMHAITTTTDGSDITGISGLFPISSAGAPVLDRSGHLMAMLIRTGSGGARTVGLAKLRQLATGGQLVAMRKPADCSEGRGSLLPVVPVLAGPGGDLARETQKMLGEYVTEVNRHNVRAVRDMFTGVVRDRTLDQMRAQYRTLTIFDPVIRNVVKDGDGAQVEMTHAALRAPDPDLDNLYCLRYDILYRLERVDGDLKIAATNKPDSSRGFEDCDTD
jgi:Trypsin-like peptidase domain